MLRLRAGWKLLVVACVLIGSMHVAVIGHAIEGAPPAFAEGAIDPSALEPFDSSLGTVANGPFKLIVVDDDEPGTVGSPTITVAKDASPASVPEPTVTFSVTVTTNSAEPVTLDGLTDDVPVDTAHVNTASATARDNEGNAASGTDDATVLVKKPTGQIAPAVGTCVNFRDGTAGDLTELSYGLRSKKVNNVAPGVLHYFSLVEATSANFTIEVLQSDTSAAFPAFGIQQ